MSRSLKKRVIKNVLTVRDKVLDQVEFQIFSLVGVQVGGKVRNLVWNTHGVYDQVWEEKVRNKVLDHE